MSKVDAKPTTDANSSARRHLLAVAAAGAVAAAIPAVALPATTDPVCAAIERYKEANATHTAALAEQDRLETLNADTDYGWVADQPCHDEWNAFDHLLAVEATTLSGLSAKIAYLGDIAECHSWMFTDRQGSSIALIESFAASLKNVGPALH